MLPRCRLRTAACSISSVSPWAVDAGRYAVAHQGFGDGDGHIANPDGASGLPTGGHRLKIEIFKTKNTPKFKQFSSILSKIRSLVRFFDVFRGNLAVLKHLHFFLQKFDLYRLFGDVSDRDRGHFSK